MAAPTVCDFDLPAPAEGPCPDIPGEGLLVRARRLVWPRPAARSPENLSREAPLEAEAREAPLPAGPLRDLVLEQTAAADVFLERRLEADPGAAEDFDLFSLAARLGTSRAVAALLRAGALGRLPPGADSEAPLRGALSRRDPQALEVIGLLAGVARRVDGLTLRAALAGLGLADPLPGEASCRGRPPLPEYRGPGAGRLGVVLASPALGRADAARLLASLAPRDLPHGLDAALAAVAAGR